MCATSSHEEDRTDGVDTKLYNEIGPNNKCRKLSENNQRSPVIFLIKNETKRNETKRNETKRNETKQKRRSKKRRIK